MSLGPMGARLLNRRFVVVSGLPGSGKSTIARRLSPLLALPVIDKDDILDRLFNVRGVGDTAWRRSLSRESDVLFRSEAEGSRGAILVSFWHQPGMPLDSGTPTDWLSRLSPLLVTLHCECPLLTAVARFTQRRRHPGHPDELKSYDETLRGIKEVAELKPVQVGARVYCDTSFDSDVVALAKNISEAFRLGCHP